MSATQVGEMNIVLSLNAATYSQAIDQAAKKLDQLAGVSKQVGHSTVTSVQAASGALRELNGDFTNNIRAVERFITTIPGVGDALKLAFPVVGGLAFGAMLAEMGVKVYDFAKKVEAIPRTINTAFEEMNNATHKAGVEIDITNDKLAIQIAKLEHKPANLLKLALDEDRLAAAGLADEIARAGTTIDGLLKKNSVGIGTQLMSFFTGESLTGTGDAEKNIRRTMKALADTQDAARDAEDNASPGADATAVRLRNRKTMQDALTKAILETSSALAKEQLADATDQFASHGPTVNLYKGTLRQLRDQQHNFEAGNQRGELEATEKGLAQKKELSEAERKAEQERLKGMEGELAAQNLLRNRTIKADYDYWAARLNVFAAGSQQFREIQGKMETLATESASKAHETVTRFVAEQKRLGIEGAGLPQNPMDHWNRENSKALADANDASNQLNALSAHNAARLEELRIEQESGKSITQIAAATQLAAAHTKEYGAELDRLQLRRQYLATTHDLDGEPDARARQLGLIDEQIAGQRAQRQYQIQQDAHSLQDGGSSAFVGARDALDEFVKSTKDAAGAMRNFLGGALGRTNESIVRALTIRHGQRTDFGAAGADIFRSATGGLLGAAEGKLLSGFGLGSKAPKGTMGDPMWVRMANGVGNAVKGVSGAAGGFLSKAGGFLSGLIPGFAEGGNPAPNSIAMVGENGPELVRFGSGGATVVPNHQMGSVMGGMGVTHVHVDARGATDPAQVEAAAHRAVRAYAPHIVAASMQAHHDSGRRRPGISGR